MLQSVPRRYTLDQPLCILSSYCKTQADKHPHGQAGLVALRSVGLDTDDFLSEVVHVVPVLQKDLLLYLQTRLKQG